MRAKTRHLEEEDIIRLLWRTSSTKQGLDPFNDDVAWSPNQGKRRFVICKSDMLVSSTDVPRQMSPRQIASKAVTACVSDFAAKGVKPAFFLVSLGIPKRLATSYYVRKLSYGFRDCIRRYGVSLLAGDTSATESDVIIDCSMFGYANSIVKRRDARPGDLIGVSANFGLQASGLKILLGKAKTNDKLFRRKAIDSVLNPKARLSLGLEISKHLSSCIDSSDGLAISLYHLAESSKVNLKLESLPIAEGVRTFAEENNLDSEELVLFGGEEYELVCTFERQHKEALAKRGVRVIGEVASSTRERPKVFHGGKVIPRRGWIHFRSSD